MLNEILKKRVGRTGLIIIDMIVGILLVGIFSDMSWETWKLGIYLSLVIILYLQAVAYPNLKGGSKC